MNSLSPCPHFVYELVDPRDMSIFYVGITIDLYNRFKQHMHCDGTNVQKDQRIQEILTSGHLPIMRTCERVESLEQSVQRENYWIYHYAQMGTPLLNAEITCLSSGRKVGGRQSNYERVKEIILHRHAHGKYPLGVSADMQRWYEFNYFTKPMRSNKTKRAITHAKSYQRGRQWIAESLELFDVLKPFQKASE